MKRKVIQLPKVDDDLEEIAVYIARDNRPAADRFLHAVLEEFEALARMPGMGPACTLQNPRAQGLRFSPIKGYRNYLVFYRPTEDGIEVVRVLHGARNLEETFEQ